MVKLFRTKFKYVRKGLVLGLKKILSAFFAVIIISTIGLGCFCNEVPKAAPTVTVEPTGEKTFSTAPSITAPNENSTSTTGTVLWVAILSLLGVIAVYMVINYIRLKKEEKLRQENELIKPKLIISTGYTKKDNYMDS